MTPSKSKGVRDVLEKEKERHRCALKLLPFFYTSEELSNSNTDGTHNKQQLDVTKLQALKVLVFSRFQLKLPRRKKKCGNPSKVKLTRSVALANMYISLLVPCNVNKVELTLCCLASIGVCFSRSELGWYISQTPGRWTAKSGTLFLFISSWFIFLGFIDNHFNGRAWCVTLIRPFICNGTSLRYLTLKRIGFRHAFRWWHCVCKFVSPNFRTQKTWSSFSIRMRINKGEDYDFLAIALRDIWQRNYSQ